MRIYREEKRGDMPMTGEGEGQGEGESLDIECTYKCE